MTQLPVGGPAATTYRVTSRAHVTGRVAVPAYLVTDGRAVEGGPSQQVYYVSDAEIASGEFIVSGDVHPIPIVAANNVYTEYPPVPIYVVNPPSPVVPSSTLLNGLQLAWNFQEDSGDATDSVISAVLTANGAIGTRAGPGIGVPKGRLMASASNQYFSIADASVYKIIGDTTFCGWIRSTTGTRGGFAKSNGATPEYGLDFDAGNWIGWIIYYGSGSHNTGYFVTPIPSVNVWYPFRCGYDDTQKKAFFQLGSGAMEYSVVLTFSPDVSNGEFWVGRNGITAAYLNGAMAVLCKWNRLLTDAEWLEYQAGGAGVLFPFDSTVAATPVLIEPSDYQMYGGSTIPIIGSMQFANSDIEAQFNGGAWQDLAINARGEFSGTLTGQIAGQGALTLRAKASGKTASETRRKGLVIGVAGQSNNSGRLTNNQTASHATITSALLGNDRVYKALIDPTDSSVGQVDTVSSDGAAAGSIWPLVATHHMNERNAPMMIVPCAKGGTSITDWQPGIDHFDRTTLYGSMAFRCRETNADVLCWWQGEQDAFAGMSQADYETNLGAFADAVAIDLPGVKIIATILQLGNSYSDANAAKIQAAINAVIAAKANVYAGPDLSAMRAESGDHFLSDANAVTIAALQWSSIKSAMGW